MKDIKHSIKFAANFSTGIKRIKQFILDSIPKDFLLYPHTDYPLVEVIVQHRIPTFLSPVEYRPTPAVRAYLKEHNYLEPYSYITGLGWYAFKDQFSTMPVLVEVPIRYIAKFVRENPNAHKLESNR